MTMKTHFLLPLLLIAAAASAGAERRVIFPAGAKPVGPYSPGIFAGDFLYVSGQGARGPDGKFPETVEGQVRQTLENVRSIVEAAGLTMEHIVYTQVYLDNPAGYGDLNRVWTQVFTKGSPARAVLIVQRMPTNTPVEVNAVAVKDLAVKKTLSVAGASSAEAVPSAVIAGDRVFISGVLGRDPATGRIPEDPAAEVQFALDGMKQALSAAGLDFRHVVFVNPYLTEKMPMNVMNKAYAERFEFGNTPARATIRVAGLPQGASIEFTGVAVRELSQRRAVRPKNMAPSPTASPCVFAGNTLYCSAKSGFIPGPQSGIYASTVEHQVRQTMRNLLDGLEEADMDFSNVVATNVYLDNIEDFDRMNRTYGQYFSSAPPTRTTVQQIAPGERRAGENERWPTLEQISVIAVK
jgi:reactive intermediate/imine deaminase